MAEEESERWWASCSPTLDKSLTRVFDEFEQAKQVGGEGTENRFDLERQVVRCALLRGGFIFASRGADDLEEYRLPGSDGKIVVRMQELSESVLLVAGIALVADEPRGDMARTTIHVLNQTPSRARSAWTALFNEVVYSLRALLRNNDESVLKQVPFELLLRCISVSDGWEGAVTLTGEDMAACCCSCRLLAAVCGEAEDVWKRLCCTELGMVTVEGEGNWKGRYSEERMRRREADMLARRRSGEGSTKWNHYRLRERWRYSGRDGRRVIDTSRRQFRLSDRGTGPGPFELHWMDREDESFIGPLGGPMSLRPRRRGESR